MVVSIHRAEFLFEVVPTRGGSAALRCQRRNRAALMALQ